MYKCIKGFSLRATDDDGRSIENEYFDVPEGSAWNTPEDKDYRFIGGEIRLESDELGWIEIDKTTLENNFEVLKIENKHCTKCKDYMRCNYNHIGLGSGNWAKECTDYIEG